MGSSDIVHCDSDCTLLFVIAGWHEYDDDTIILMIGLDTTPCMNSNSC